MKTYLLPDRSRTGKRKSKVRKHTINPVFDEILTVSALILVHIILSFNKIYHNDNVIQSRCSDWNIRYLFMISGAIDGANS